MGIPPVPRHKIVITGTGRAGTTLLVRLLTELGLDTGYTRENWRAEYFAHCEAGLEKKILDPGAPYIVKDPNLCDQLGHLVDAGEVVVDHAIVPVRQLEAAAQSRARVGGAWSNVPGGLVRTAAPEQQQFELAVLFHQLLHTLVRCDIPFTLLEFPRFARDPHYAFQRLEPIFRGTSWPDFEAAFARVVDCSLIHEFGGGEYATIRTEHPADVYLAKERRRRRRRRLRQTLLASLAAAALAVGAFRLGQRAVEPPPGRIATVPAARETPASAVAAPAEPAPTDGAVDSE